MNFVIKNSKFFVLSLDFLKKIPRYGIGSHKKGKLFQAPRSRNLLYTPTICTETTNQNLVWSNFEEFYALITSSK